MTENEREGRKALREFMEFLIRNTDIPKEEQEDCIESCPGYLKDVIYKSMKMDKTSDEPGYMRAAILGFVGGYASRHLYAFKYKNENGA